MRLGTAAILLLSVFAGMAAAGVLLRRQRTARTVLLVLLSLLALALVVYIGLTLFFVDAVGRRPPV